MQRAGTEPALGGNGKGSRTQDLVQGSPKSGSEPEQRWVGGGGGQQEAPSSPSLAPLQGCCHPLGSPFLGLSPSPLMSILANTVSVNSSALMDESLQGLMVRMAWEDRQTDRSQEICLRGGRASRANLSGPRAVQSGDHGTSGPRALGILRQESLKVKVNMAK